MSIDFDPNPMGSGHPPTPHFESRRLIYLIVGANPEAISTDEWFTFQNAMAYGYKGFNADGTPIANTNAIYWGFQSDAVPNSIPAGEARGIESDSGKRMAATKVWIQGTPGDGIVLVTLK